MASTAATERSASQRESARMIDDLALTCADSRIKQNGQPLTRRQRLPVHLAFANFF